MNDKQYDELIKKLQNTKPLHENPQELTNQILYEVNRLQRTKKSGNNNFIAKQLVFKLRPIMAAAAVLLIGFFIYQQWEVMQKMNQLEGIIRTSGQVNSPDLPGNTKQLLYKYAGYSEIAKNKKEITGKDSIANILVRRLEELQNENEQLKAIIKARIADDVKNINKKSL